MPTKQDAPLRIIRAAAMVIISSAVYFVSGMGHRGFQTALELVKIPGREHMPLHPGLKRFTLTCDGVPLLVEGVIARVIALRVGGKRSALHHTDRAHHP